MSGRHAGARTWHHPAALLLMVASGFAGLGYQVVWTQQSALWLGHESAAVLAVVAAFFGGLGLGALLLGPRIERSPRPARWYAACELAIAAWGLALLALMAPASDALRHLIGAQPSPLRQWVIAFGGTLSLLAPATMAMGATLPAIEKVMADPALPRRSIAIWYAGNTFGAVLGVLATAFWLVPDWGLSRTAGLCVALNVLCAVVAWFALPLRLDGTRPMQAEEGENGRACDASCGPASTSSPSHQPDAADARRLLWLLAFTGLFGIGYEVLVVRVLSQVTEDTVYTFAMLLAVYLVGTALGAAAWQRWLARVDDAASWTARLLGILATSCLIGASSLWASEWIHAGLRALMGQGMAAAIGAEAGLALAAFAVPTLAMGALFSHLGACASGLGVGFGRALGVNTLGAAVAPCLFGVLLAPALGPKWTLMLLPIGYVALIAFVPSGPFRPFGPFGPLSRREHRRDTGTRVYGRSRAWLVAPAGLALAIGLCASPLAFVELPQGGHVVDYRDGIMAAVSVVEDADGVARLRINNRQQEGSSATLLVDGRQAMLPMLLHPSPHRALFLGLGTGVTSGTAAEDPGLDVDAVELLPEVIAASRHFARVFDREAPNERLHVIPADARRFARASQTSYDLIVSDNFQPARSGSGALYTVEHFRAVRARLAPQGLFCQWLPLHQLDIPTLRSIVRSFLTAYPKGMAILASNSLETPVIGLVGRQDDGRFDADALRERLAANTMPRPPSAFGIGDEFALLGSIVAGPSSLRRFAQGARANTDDLPVVAYMAPRATYAPASRPGDRLVTLLAELSVSPGEVLKDVATQVGSRSGHMEHPSTATRLAAYWSARNRFIEIGRNVRPTPDVHAMLAQVGEPLLDVLRISADFRPAYEPMVGMAMALAREGDTSGAQALLGQLVKLQPAWPEASDALLALRQQP